MKFTVRTVELRTALRAVVLHADPEPDFADTHRLRVERQPDAVTFSATNRFTVAHAYANLFDQGDGELGAFDLHPRNVAEILALFKVAKDQTANHAVMIEVTDKTLAVTEVSGLFDGKTLTLPRHPSDDTFPNIGQIIATKVESLPVAEPVAGHVLSGQLVELFVKSADLYGQRLVFDFAGKRGPLLVTAGEFFIGILMPVIPNEDDLAQIKGWQLDWLLRTEQQIEAGA